MVQENTGMRQYAKLVCNVMLALQPKQTDGNIW